MNELKTFEEEAVKHYNNLTKSALRLNEIVKEQQQRIDKAIEYIETNANYDENIKQCRDNLYDCECDDLLEILKGETK